MMTDFLSVAIMQTELKRLRKSFKKVFIPTKRRTKVSHTGNYVKIPLLE